jgi:methylmalonyl-CoA mutase cobalamin-binding subunit
MTQRPVIVSQGGVISRLSYDFLYIAGVKGVYCPGTTIPVFAGNVLSQIEEALASQP